MERLIKAVEQSVSNLIEHDSFLRWLNRQRVDAGDLIVINNSFVYRSVSTTKSNKYLSIKVGDDGNPQIPPLVAQIPRINSDFRHFPARSAVFPVVSIEKAVKDELTNLGLLVFVLIGGIDDSIILEEKVDHKTFEKIVWNPSQPEMVFVDYPTIHVREVYDEEVVWEAVAQYYTAQGREIPHGLREAIGISLDHLQDKAVALLHLPHYSPASGDTPSMTDAIVQVLREQRQEYAKALAESGGRHSASSSAYNDLLRIAYNFSSDATTFLSLIVSVCDLKPIILWGTIDKHFALSEAFRSLPWTRSRNKPSLQNYISIISDARNSAFHNLFPFRKSLEIPLPENALQNARLRIFSEYGKKKENQLIYQDQELVNVLVKFTRARNRQVSPHFWRKNLEVMDATIELFVATGAFLRTLFEVSQDDFSG